MHGRRGHPVRSVRRRRRLIGAIGVTLAGNQITGNVRGGATEFQGGVVVTTGLGTLPTNNKVAGNLVLGNAPDVFWDGTGSGNTFLGNRCATSSPPGLCH